MKNGELFNLWINIVIFLFGVLCCKIKGVFFLFFSIVEYIFLWFKWVFLYGWVIFYFCLYIVENLFRIWFDVVIYKDENSMRVVVIIMLYVVSFLCMNVFLNIVVCIYLLLFINKCINEFKWIRLCYNGFYWMINNEKVKI